MSTQKQDLEVEVIGNDVVFKSTDSIGYLHNKAGEGCKMAYSSVLFGASVFRYWNLYRISYLSLISWLTEHGS